MVALFFGDRADLVCKRQRFRKVGEAEFLLEVMLLDHLPATAQLMLQIGEILAL